jgi:hypothetical protein
MTIILGILGLALSILGTFFMFTKAIPVEPINAIGNFKNETHSPFDLYKDLIAKLEDVRKDINEKNKRAHRRSKSWLFIIVLGTFLQIFSLITSFF